MVAIISFNGGSKRLNQATTMALTNFLTRKRGRFS